MSQKKLAALLVMFVFWPGTLLAITPTKHIRVILDTSQSLRKNDPSGYVKLATALLYDLAWQTLNPNDSFKVLQFQTDWPDWEKPGAAPPAIPSLQTYLKDPKRGNGDRAQFIRQIREIRYDAQKTYFSPGFQWALDDLVATKDPKSNRVVVLITDGVPDSKDKDGMALSLLAKRLREEQIRVYVLAFSQAIIENRGWFTANLGIGPGGVRGDVVEAADASHLLSDTLEIFSRSFGYSRQTVGAAPTQIDVAANSTVERAAVVALYQQAGDAGFELTPPSGPGVGRVTKESALPDPNGQGSVRPVSYAYVWVDPPVKGNYGFKATGGQPAEVAVLRPVHVEARIRPANGVPIAAVMAGKPTAMEVLVYPTSGGSGDPGKDLRVHFYLHYFTQDDTSQPQLFPSQEMLLGTGEGKLTNEGRVFVINPEFVPNPPGAPPIYKGFIETVVQQFDVPVESSGELMHPVNVYPYVSIQPNPARAVAAADGYELLETGARGCVQFRFEGNAKSLGEGNFTMGVRLDPPLNLAGPFREAKLMMNGKELRGAGAQVGEWQTQVPFDAGGLGAEFHTFCMQVGRPTREATETVKVHFGLLKDSDQYYQQLNVVAPDLEVTFKIASPGSWQTWGPWLILLLSLLLTYLLFLFWKSRRTLPSDLAVSLGDGTPVLTAARLGETSIASRWFGFPQDRPVISLGGDTEIGFVRPLGGELFSFVPRGGFGNLNAEENGEWRPVEPREDGSWLISAGRVYRAGAGENARFFRLDYSKERPWV